MGYRKVPTIYTLDEIEDEPGLVVRMKAIKIGKLRKLTAASSGDDDEIGDNLDVMFGVLLEGLVSWNLEDEAGNPVPPTLEGLEDQELSLVMNIIRAWTEKASGVDDDLGKDSPAGGKFPGRPLTMEAL